MYKYVSLQEFQKAFVEFGDVCAEYRRDGGEAAAAESAQMDAFAAQVKIERDSV